MERTLGELCELLSLQRKRIQKLKENEYVKLYLEASQAEEDILKEVKPIIKNAKMGYETDSIVLQYQPRFKRLREFNIDLVKSQKWGMAVIEEKVNEETFDALSSTITDPEKYYTVKEVDVSAVIIKDK